MKNKIAQLMMTDSYFVYQIFWIIVGNNDDDNEMRNMLMIAILVKIVYYC